MAASMFGEDESSDDLYTLLNVERNASKEDIDSSFRKMAKIYHPDRHTQAAKKKAAENLFNKIKQAHEILTDPNRREIYDRFGRKGLEIKGLEIITRTRSPAEIIAELNMFQQEQEKRLLEKRTNPRSVVSVGVNATDLFESYADNAEEFEDDEFYQSSSGLSSVEVNQFSMAQTVDCPLTPKDVLTLGSSMSIRNGNGNGSFTAIWRRITSPKGWGQLETTIGEGFMTTLRGFRYISNKCYCTASATTVFNPKQNYIGLTNVRSSLNYQFDHSLQGKITWSVGQASSMRTYIVYDREKYNFTIAFQLGIHSFIEAGYLYKFRTGEDTARISAKIGTSGALIKYGCEKKITQFSTLGATMVIGVPVGVLLKIRLVRGQQVFMFPIHLSDSIVPMAVVYGTLVPLAVYGAVKKFIITPYLQQKEAEENEKKKEEFSEKLSEQRKEAEATVELMRETVERSVAAEDRKKGLVIVKAVYGKITSIESDDIYSCHCIDVTIPMQALVKDSQIVLTDHKSKCEIPGFYDPCPGQDKKLFVRYRFRNKMHEALLSDTDSIRLPLQKHVLADDTG